MADPISISASVAGLISLADLVFSRAYTYIKAVDSAPEEAQSLVSSLGALSGILHNLFLVARQMEGEPVDATIRINYISSCRRTMEKMKKKLGSFDMYSSDDKLRLRKRLKWPFSATEVKSLGMEIERHKSTLSLALNVDSLSALLRSLSGQKDLEDGIEEIRFELKRQREAESHVVLSQERRAIVNWIQPYDPHQHHQMNLKLRYLETGLWLISGEEFQSWLSCGSSKLWCHGIPGAGKTVLCATIVEEALSHTDTDTVTAFYYCDYKSAITQNPRSILGSIAKQIAVHNEETFQMLQEYYIEKNPKDQSSTECDPQEVRNLIVSMASSFKNVMVIVDGLDECATQVKSVTRLLASLGKSGETKNIKCLFLSRDESDIRFGLDGFEKVSIAASSSDISLFVAAQIEERILNQDLRLRDPALKDEILERLVQGAKGMFRWVTCQLDWLCQCPHDLARRNALSSLPPGLYGTYQRILQRVEENDKEVRVLVSRALRWLTCSNEPLDTTALCEAISTKLGDKTLAQDVVPHQDEICRWCSSLVRKSISGDYLELAHFTVKEYLLSSDNFGSPELSKYHFKQESADPELALVCLTYLGFDKFNGSMAYCRESFQGQSGDSFLLYAVAHWFEHARDHLGDPTIFRLTQQLLHPSKPNIFISWAREMVEYIQGDQDYLVYAEDLDLASSTPLHFAAALALPQICAWLLESGCNVNQASVVGNPLDCAIRGLQALTMDGAKEPEADYFYCLSYEGRTSRSATIRLIIESGADINVSCLAASPFCDAAFMYDTVTCIELLCKGAFIDPKSVQIIHEEPELADRILLGIEKHTIRAQDRAALLEIALLYEKNHFKNLSGENLRIAQDSRNLTSLVLRPFIAAARWGQIDVVRRLWDEHEFDINAIDEENGETALHEAASNDQVEIVKFLIQNGAGCDLSDDGGRTPLHRSLDTSSGSLQYIAEHSQDIDLPDKDGITVWHLAASNRDIQVLRTLSRFTVDRNPKCGLKDEVGRTPIHCAAQSGSLTTISYMLDHCNDNIAHDVSFDGSTALHYAVGTTSLPAVQYLIDKGFNVHALRGDGSNMLHCAIDQYHAASSEIVELLIGKGINPCCVRSDGLTAIDLLMQKASNDWHYSRMDRSWEIIRLSKKLTQNVVALTYMESSEQSALYQLCQIHSEEEHWKSDALRIILNVGPNWETKDRICSVALVYIADSWTRMIPTGFSHDQALKVASRFSKPVKIILDCFRNKALISEICADPLLLCHAIVASEDELACELLQYTSSVDVVPRQVYQSSPLILACYLGSRKRLLKELIRRSSRDRGAVGCSFDLFRTTFHEGARNSSATVEILLEEGFDPNDYNLEGVTVLMLATKSGHLRIVEELIEQGANADATDYFGWDVIHYACIAESRNDSLLQLLKSCIPDWDRKISIDVGPVDLPLRVNRATLLHLAASQSNGSLEYLLRNDMVAEIDALSERKHTPLHVAACCGMSNNVALLLDNGSNDTILEDHGYAAIHFAAMLGYREVLDVFIGKERSLRLQDRLGLTPDLVALINGHAYLANALRGEASVIVDVSTMDKGQKRALTECLQVALELGDVARCESLIAGGVGCGPEEVLHCNGCTPVLYAFSQGRPEIARLLVSKGASIEGSSCDKTSFPGFTSFHHAAALGDTDLLGLLYEKAPGIKLHYCRPVHPIHLAIARGYIDCVEIILAQAKTAIHGKDYDLGQLVNTRIGDDALDRKGLEEAMLTMRDTRLDSATPLHTAAFFGRTDIAKILLNSGASVDSEDANWATPLHFAAWQGQLETLKLLMEHGANTNAVDNSLDTPLMWAVQSIEDQYPVLEILSVLLDGGADLNWVDGWGTLVFHNAMRNDRWDALVFLLTNFKCDDAFGRSTDGSSLMAVMIAYVPPSLHSFLLNLAPLPDVYQPTRRSNVLRVAACLTSAGFLKGLLRRLPQYLIPTLLEHRAADTDTPLYAAATSALEANIQLLLDAGAQLEQEGGDFGTPLMGACAIGRLSIVKLLVSKGAKTSYVKDGRVIDAFSVAKNHLAVRRWLLVGRFTDIRFITEGEKCR